MCSASFNWIETLPSKDAGAELRKAGGAATRNRAGLVALTMILLGALVWALSPRRPKLTPAPLRPPLPACARLRPEFIPSSVTEFPDSALAGVEQLADREKYRALYRLNLEPCTCGCMLSIAECRVTNLVCQTSKRMGQEVVSEAENERVGPVNP